MPVGKSAIVYDKYQYEWEKRLVVFFLFGGTFLAVGSFVSDLLNYLEFASYESDGFLGDESGSIGLQDMKTAFLIFVIVAGVVYGLEVIFMLVAFIGLWPRSSNGRQAIMWTRELFSIVDSILCDVTFLVLYYLSFGVGFCPMLHQLRSHRGKVAVALTSAHAVFAIIQSVYYRKIVGRYPSNCERLLKKFCWMWHVLIASFAFFALVAAIIYYPIHSAMTRQQFREWGIGERQSASVYVIQDLNVSDIIQKQYEATGLGNSPRNSTQFDEKLVKLLRCKQIRNGLYISDLGDIVNAEDGIVKRYSCTDVSSFDFMVQEDHRKFIGNSDCIIFAKVKYDFRSSLLIFSIGYELRPHQTADECYWGYFKMTDPKSARVLPYNVDFANEIPYGANKIIVGTACSGCYGNDTTNVANLFSCLDKNCYRFNSTSERATLRVSAFRIAWSVQRSKYQSDLGSLRSLLQCRTGVKASEASLELCGNSTEQTTQAENINELCI